MNKALKSKIILNYGRQDNFSERMGISRSLVSNVIHGRREYLLKKNFVGCASQMLCARNFPRGERWQSMTLRPHTTIRYWLDNNSISDSLGFGNERYHRRYIYFPNKREIKLFKSEGQNCTYYVGNKKKKSFFDHDLFQEHKLRLDPQSKLYEWGKKPLKDGRREGINNKQELDGLFSIYLRRWPLFVA